MSVDVKQPKGYRKAWNGSFRPEQRPTQMICCWCYGHGDGAGCPNCGKAVEALKREDAQRTDAVDAGSVVADDVRDGPAR